MYLDKPFISRVRSWTSPLCSFAVCVFAHVYMCVGVCARRRLWPCGGQSQPRVLLRRHCPSSFWNWVSCWPSTFQTGEDSWLVNPNDWPVSTPPVPGLQLHATSQHTCIFVWPLETELCSLSHCPSPTTTLFYWFNFGYFVMFSLCRSKRALNT